MVNVADTNRCESLGQLCLRQTWLTAQRGEAHVDEDMHVLLQQLADQVANRFPFIADADKGSFACGAILVCGVTGSHGFLWCTTPLGTGR